MKVVDTDIV